MGSCYSAASMFTQSINTCDLAPPSEWFIWAGPWGVLGKIKTIEIRNQDPTPPNTVAGTTYFSFFSIIVKNIKNTYLYKLNRF